MIVAASFVLNDFLGQFVFDSPWADFFLVPVLIASAIKIKNRLAMLIDVKLVAGCIALIAYLTSSLMWGGDAGAHVLLSIARFSVFLASLVLFICVIRNDPIFFKKVLNDISLLAAGISLIYISLVVLVNLDIVSDSWGYKTYAGSAFTRVAFLFDEPIDVGIFFCIALLINRFDPRRRLQNCILVAGVLSTLSAGAYLLMLAMMFEKLKAKSMFSIILGSVACLALLTPQIFDRFDRILSLQDGSTRIRLAILVAGVQIMLANPAGVGWGRGAEMIGDYTTLFSDAVWMSELGFSSAYSLVGAELGLVPFLTLSIYLVYSSFQVGVGLRKEAARFLVILFLISAKILSPLTFIVLAIFAARLPDRAISDDIKFS